MDKLGFGLMRLPHTNPDDAATVDIEKVINQVDFFLSQGFTYFDTAWMYNNFGSEKAAKTALVERHDRSAFTLADKLHANYFNTFEDRDKIFNAQLENTGVTYFDYYLLHGIGDGNYEKFERFDCFNWILAKKKAGLVKNVGFSYHAGPELLDEILTAHPEMEFVQLQINYIDWEGPIQSKACYDVCVKHGKKVVVMEPVKGGTLARMPKEVEELFKAAHPDWSIPSWAIRFAASLPNVFMVLSGMNTMGQMVDNTRTVANMEPLSEEDLAVIRKAVDIMNSMNSIACTGCAYCAPGCPMEIAIPQYFALYNADIIEAPDKGWHPQYTYYAGLTKTHGKASDCIECGQCEGMCPQHLPIVKYLKDVAARLER